MGYFMDWLWLALGLPDALPWKATRGEIPRWEVLSWATRVNITKLGYLLYGDHLLTLFDILLSLFVQNTPVVHVKKCQLILCTCHNNAICGRWPQCGWSTNQWRAPATNRVTSLTIHYLRRSSIYGIHKKENSTQRHKVTASVTVSGLQMSSRCDNERESVSPSQLVLHSTSQSVTLLDQHTSLLNHH